jgi:hypothetical protein
MCRRALNLTTVRTAASPSVQILQWLVLLLFRSTVVTLCAPFISRILVRCGYSLLVWSGWEDICFPFIRRVCKIEPRPLQGTLSVHLVLDGDTFIRLLGYEHTTFFLDEDNGVHLEFAIWCTPLCPLWRAGVRIMRLEMRGGTRDWLSPAHPSNTLQTLAASVQLEASVHVWGMVGLVFPILPQLPDSVTGPDISFEAETFKIELRQV